MNKLISMMIVFVMSFMSISAFAAYEAPVKFDMVYNYENKVYTTYYEGGEGGETFKRGNVNVYTVPVEREYSYKVWNFCFYNNKIYFLAGEVGSEALPACIYSADADGGNIRLLADNASSFSNVYIVDNILYYDAYVSIGRPLYEGHYGVIQAIDLTNLSWRKIVGKSNLKMSYCDGDFAYYRIGYDGPCYATSTDGRRTIMVSEYCDEFNVENIVKGNQTYFLYNGNVYVRERNGNGGTWLGSVPDDGMTWIYSVTDDKIYCGKYECKGGYYPQCYIHVYEVDR